MSLRRLASYGPAFVFGVAIVLLWELAVRAGYVNDFYLPAPSAIIVALVQNWDVIAGHTLQTLLETVLGLVVAIVLGLLLALEARALPERWRMRGLHKYLTRALCFVTIGFGLYMVPQALGWL